jgi:hypothetical protein
MTEAEWLFGTDPVALLLSLRATASDRKLRLFAVSVTRAEREEWYAERWEPYLIAAEQIADGLLPDNSHGGSETDSIRARDLAYRAARSSGSEWVLWKCRLLREIFGNPFRPMSFSPDWHTDTVLVLAQQMYEARDFSAMPILADALQDAGCNDPEVLDHCRQPGVHVRGCWVVDLVLGKG